MSQQFHRGAKVRMPVEKKLTLAESVIGFVGYVRQDHPDLTREKLLALVTLIWDKYDTEPSTASGESPPTPGDKP